MVTSNSKTPTNSGKTPTNSSKTLTNNGKTPTNNSKTINSQNLTLSEQKFEGFAARGIVAEPRASAKRAARDGADSPTRGARMRPEAARPN